MDTPTSPHAPHTSGLAPNVAATLAYVAGFITGIIFLMIEKENKEVRFHAWQSIFLNVAIFVLQIAASILVFVFGNIAGFLAALISFASTLILLAALVFWIICMIKAYRLEHYKVPIIGDMAEAQAAK